MIDTIEDYLKNEQLKYSKNKKIRKVLMILFSTIIISFLFFKPPEKKEIDIILKNLNEEVKISVTSSSTLKNVLEEHGLNSQNLYYLNGENITFKELQRLKVKKKIVITYVIVSFDEITITEEIEFKTKKREDDSLLVGTEMIEKEGKVGTKEIKTKIEFHDGVEVNKEIKETVKVTAIDKVILIGTKPNVGNDGSTDSGGSNSGNGSSLPNIKDDGSANNGINDNKPSECTITINGVVHHC